jgi:hypothetical protein
MSIDMAAMQADYEANMSMWRLPSEIEALAEEVHGIREQLRIANLIALNQEARVNSPAARSLYQVDDSQFGSMVKGLQPDIAEALGIGGETDD